MKKYIFIFFICFGFSQERDISFVRFYLNEKDFISDIRLEASQRHSKPYLQAFYNEKKLPIIKEVVMLDGTIISRELMDYDDKGILLRKYFTNNDYEPDSLIQYGKNEPWSKEFRKAFSSRNKGYFDFQESKFILNSSNQFNKIIFTDVQGVKYGEINFIYDHLGMLRGERWIDIQTGAIIRNFLYNNDMLSGRKEIKEFGLDGQLVSHIVLSQPPAENLYKTSPPRYGNRLDEISILLEDIYNKDHSIPFDIFIPRTDHDLMILSNGDSLMVKMIDIGQLNMTFQLIGESSKLTMPSYRVKSIISKFGEKIYP